ncbi:MAG: hypothetical protein H0U13_08860 [Gemmatimonadaceae bacterium]|nr:hypothetical protein [Gemmatimonadaceae bacterium]
MADSDAGIESGRLTPRVRTLALWIAALATIALGFADLARGGTTMAPFLLVLGYCVLVPVAILK